MPLHRLDTGISTAYWCNVSAISAQYEKAQLILEGQHISTISWFDLLLKGGIAYFPDQPLTILLSGPPGTGKTTLALELCYRLATKRNPHNSGGMAAQSSLYVSTDSDSGQLIEHANGFRWPDVSDYLFAVGETAVVPSKPAVAVWGRENVKRWETLLDLVEEAAEALLTWLTHLPPDLWDKVGKLFRFTGARNAITVDIRTVGPHIVVMDGLNALAEEDRESVFQAFLKGIRSANDPPKIVILVLDTGGEKAHPAWEYVCDMVIRLDHSYNNGYYSRTIEIAKARYQEHVWGRHQVKVYSASIHGDRQITARRRAHPYREEGGLYIYPSIHYYLSAYKRSAPMTTDRVDTLPPELNSLLKNGYPKQRCTAFMGARGSHKSHLAYLHLLYRIIKHKERGLIVSLRDDEAVTRHTLSEILQQQFGVSPEDCEAQIDRLESSGELEILYYVPGYITPEEFMHRMLMSVYRMQHGGSKLSSGAPHLTVLFNSLDQLAARFPLCAGEQIFVPGVIEVLSGIGTSTIVVVVEEAGQPSEQYGLLSMADLIVRFQRRHFAEASYLGHVQSSTETDAVDSSKLLELQTRLQQSSAAAQRSRDVVVLEVERMSGGQPAGAHGILEYVDAPDAPGCVYQRPGLHLIALDPSYSYGEAAL